MASVGRSTTMTPSGCKSRFEGIRRLDSIKPRSLVAPPLSTSTAFVSHSSLREPEACDRNRKRSVQWTGRLGPSVEEDGSSSEGSLESEYLGSRNSLPRLMLPLLSTKSSSGTVSSVHGKPKVAGVGKGGSVTSSLKTLFGVKGRGSVLPDRRRRRSSAAESQSDADDAFEAWFDLTTERLIHIFAKFDKTGTTNRVSYQALRQGLREWMDLEIEDDASFEDFVDLVDQDGSNDISFVEFESGVRMLMMNSLFNDCTGAFQCPVSVIDYNPVHTDSRLLESVESVRSFMYENREEWVDCRWLHVSGDDGHTLKQLAVKYRLHPLALEDAMLADVRPKMDRYSTHFFFVVPVFSVLQNSTESSEHTRTSLTVATHNVCIFACVHKPIDEKGEQTGGVEFNTLITYQRDEHGDNAMSWDNVLCSLNKSYSKLRQYDTQYLLYVLLDTLVNKLLLVVKVFQEALEHDRDELLAGGSTISFPLYDLKLQLEQILRKLRPLARLFGHAIEDADICDGVTLYLKDVQDNLEAIEDDIRGLIGMCDSLAAQLEKAHSLQMEQTMYRLTVVTSIFLPCQFMTGVWGMNFDNMPELHWKYGYCLFWACSLLCVLLLKLYFRFSRVDLIDAPSRML
eukprot:TRINITY_DN62369_c0_g1_i1.p1 TRINITY_DN62369_c0_g1~~TRINITY_DN62369_c0_g1_i1.p1  ORF type:complete len:626 (-),score=100.56 TRINITY_DN62369_c0_g1_i1:39-1916(-)